MHLPHLPLLLLLTLSSLATTTPIPSQSTTNLITTLAQAGHRLSYLLDTKNYAALDTVLTQDVTFDATELRAGGGITHGFAETAAALKNSGVGAKTDHQITNVLLLAEISAKKARVNSYIAYSHWVENALNDPTKTWRIYYRCDDIWVLQGGTWKLQSSKTYNMGFGTEAMYYGKKKG